MSHHHTHHHSEQNALSLAFWLNLGFSVIELIGGILTNSTAIVADAFHDGMDSIALGGAILMEKLSGKKRTTRFSYGFRRFSLLSALLLSLLLLIGAGVMIMAAYQSFLAPREVHSLGMLGLAFLGILINGSAFWKIKKTTQTHHGHTHAEQSHNTRSIMLHLLEDVLGWIAILVGAVIIYLTGWSWIDGVLAIGIALFIGYNAVKNLVRTMGVMLQSVPENVDITALYAELEKVDDISGIHDVHVWSLDGSYHISSVHIVTSNTDTVEDIVYTVRSIMRRHNIDHPTIQIETEGDDCELLTH